MVVVFPELSTEEDEEEEEGDDEDGSSDEFTDSIEEDDNKVTARSLASNQVQYFCLHLIVAPLTDLNLCLMTGLVGTITNIFF